MTRQVFAAEINFEDAPLHVREKFNGTEKNIRQILTAFRPRVDEIYILATPLRFTVYAVHENMTPLTHYFHEEHNLKGYVQFYYNTAESVTHLFATASGLLSPLKGELSILSEINDSYQLAASCGCLGINLDHLLQKAISIGKAVRTASGIDKFSLEVVETGMSLLYDRLEDLHHKKFFIIGTGKMARLALSSLCEEGFRNISLAGEDYTRALALGTEFEVTVVPMEKAGNCFYHADVVIAASYMPLNFQITTDKKQTATGRREKKRFIIDLGMPLNFDSQWVETYADELYNLDDLRRLQPSALESFGGLELAWKMVMKESGSFVHLLQQLQHSPVLAAYLTRVFSIRNTESISKPKRTLKGLLSFKKADAASSTQTTRDDINARVHANNYLAENGREIVMHMKGVGKFKFFLSDN